MADPEAAEGIRFIVRSVSGFSGTSAKAKETTNFFVLDRVFCSREVPHLGHGGKWWWTYASRYGAEQHAATLNERYGPWPQRS